MNEYLKVKIYIYNLESFIKYANKNNINLLNVINESNYIICIINNNDLNKINKYYKVEVLKYYTKHNYINYIYKNIINIINIVYIIIIFLFLSNIIVDVNINIDNKDIINKLNVYLENNGIKRLSFRKNYDDLLNIKNNILNEFNDDIEWLEIENIGMIYNIKVELRKKDNIINNYDRCNIVANKNGVVTKVISSSGDVLITDNSYVKSGDILISGNIKLNDDIKGDICASGRVYAERWYSISIDIPNSIEEKKYTNKKRYNFLYNDYMIFKDRLNSYDSEKILLLSLLGNKLYLIKEYEYIKKDIILDDDMLNNRIDELIISNLDISLSDDEKILYKNILKKEENNSRIIIEVFVTVEELISEQVTY